MRIEHARDGNQGLKATLYDGEHQIGYIRHGTVGFHGFDTSSAAAEGVGARRSATKSAIAFRR